MVRNVEEIALPQSPTCLGLDAGAIAKFLVAVVLLAVALLALIIPQKLLLEDAGAALCGVCAVCVCVRRVSGARARARARVCVCVCAPRACSVFLCRCVYSVVCFGPV